MNKTRIGLTLEAIFRGLRHQRPREAEDLLKELAASSGMTDILKNKKNRGKALTDSYMPALTYMRQNSILKKLAAEWLRFVKLSR